MNTTVFNMNTNFSFASLLFRSSKAALLLMIAGGGLTATAQTNFFDFSVELGEARLTLQSNTNVYYIVEGSEQLPQFAPWDITLGDEGAVYQVPATNAQMFFRPLSISIYSPRFTLGDGIDDMFKLRRGLDPLDDGLASQNSGYLNANSQPLTWLQYYLQQFATDIPNGENYSREVSIFNFGQPTATYEAISREVSLFNGESQPLVAVPLEVYSREISVFNFGMTFGSADAISREISVFNFGQPAAAYEAHSREVSVYNGESQPLSDLQEVYSREVSVFNGGVATATYEAISREVSLFNNIEGATN